MFYDNLYCQVPASDADISATRPTCVISDDKNTARLTQTAQTRQNNISVLYVRNNNNTQIKTNTHGLVDMVGWRHFNY